MEKKLNADIIPILRPDCKIKRSSYNRFIVNVNEREEFIDLDKETGDLLSEVVLLIDGEKSIKTISKKISQEKTPTLTSEIEDIINNLFKWGIISILTECHVPEHKHDKSIIMHQLSNLSSYSSYPSELLKKLERTTVAIVGAKYISPIIFRSLYLSGIRNFKLIGNHDTSSQELCFFSSPQIKVGIDWITALSNEASYLKFSPDFESILDMDETYLITKFKEIDVLLISIPYIGKELILKLNEICLKTDTKILFSEIQDSKVIIGPFVKPHETACILCRELRNIQYYSNINSLVTKKIIDNSLSGLDSFNIIPVMSVSLLFSLAHMISEYLCMHILDIQSLLINQEHIIDFSKMNISNNFILKLPRCPACGYNTVSPEYEYFANYEIK
ncbi:MAG: hypothetical protein RAP70_00030 [Candidatus Celaenobacter antarcticus]|nr:hypothetical protein [Candidatus Celaenobacter antarcticus]